MNIVVPIEERAALERTLNELAFPTPVHYAVTESGPNAVFTIATTPSGFIVLKLRWNLRTETAQALDQLYKLSPDSTYEKGKTSRPKERPLRLPSEDGLGLGG